MAHRLQLSGDGSSGQLQFDWNAFADNFQMAFDATFNVDLDDDDDGA